MGPFELNIKINLLRKIANDFRTIVFFLLFVLFPDTTLRRVITTPTDRTRRTFLTLNMKLKANILQLKSEVKSLHCSCRFRVDHHDILAPIRPK